MKKTSLSMPSLPGWLVLSTLLLVTPNASVTARAAQPPAQSGDARLQQIGVTRGLCVVLGDVKCELALKLARETELLVYVQLPNAADVAKARRAVDAAGFYGTRIYVEQGPLTRLHLANDLADAVVAVGDATGMPEAEALRVLHPQAKAILGNKELVKPVPAGVDDWSHFYHGPDNNPVSRDQVARAPYLTHFLAEPHYAALPQVAVASAGRVFKAFGHLAYKEREEPWLNTLAAFNGYNGTLLWRREIPAGLMIHRSTLIATPDKLYFGDDKSCKVIDAATGGLRDEIVVVADRFGGTFWKWMALEDGVLYALVGEDELRDPVIRAKRDAHGWPWNPMSPGFNFKEDVWGFGKTLVAIDPATKQVLWRRQETEPVDSRALCLKNERLYAFCFGSYLACLDAKNGKEIWRRTQKNAPELFAALGEFSKRQDWRTNWRTTAYLKCGDQSLYFAGPAVTKLLAVSTADGHVLWEHPYDNYQLIIRDDALYGIGGQIDKDPARKFDPLTGKILEEIPLGRRACTRVNGAVDAIFCRAGEGSTRLDLASSHPQLVSPMRPNCNDGVTIANGLLYWWPSTCDCNLTLYGITCLGPAGDFDFSQPAIESERLETFAKDSEAVASLKESSADWPTFRANSACTVTTEVSLPVKTRQLWESSAPVAFTPTPPTAVGDFVFLGGTDGIVRALNVKTGKLQWKAYTGGDVRYPPTIWKDRAFVGSGDGWVYAFEARTGRPLWRFRAAPVERRIPIYGELQSTWPVASGVLVEGGTAYVAAGIVNYDGTHVYALDAATGRLKWQNNTSGHLDSEAHTGVSVQGHMMVSGGRLYLAGGNAVSPAMFDIRDGKCFNEPQELRKTLQNNVIGSFAPRGSELYRIGNATLVSGKPLYSHPKYGVYDPLVLNKTLLATSAGGTIAWMNNSRLLGFTTGDAELPESVAAAWGKPQIPGLKPSWEVPCKDSVALALGRNAVVVAQNSEVVAFDLQNGRQLWSQSLPVAPVPWGLCVNRDGRVIVTLENGKVLCFGPSEMAAAQ